MKLTSSASVFFKVVLPTSLKARVAYWLEHSRTSISQTRLNNLGIRITLFSLGSFKAV